MLRYVPSGSSIRPAHYSSPCSTSVHAAPARSALTFIPTLQFVDSIVYSARPPSSSTSSVGLHNTRCNHLRQVIRKRRSSTAAHTGSSGNSSSNNSGTSNHCYNSISDTCSIIAVFVAVACGAHMYAFLQGIVQKVIFAGFFGEDLMKFSIWTAVNAMGIGAACTAGLIAVITAADPRWYWFHFRNGAVGALFGGTIRMPCYFGPLAVAALVAYGTYMLTSALLHGFFTSEPDSC